MCSVQLKPAISMGILLAGAEQLGHVLVISAIPLFPAERHVGLWFGLFAVDV